MRGRCSILRLGEHPCGFENGQVGLGGNIDHSLVAEVRLLAHPEILNVGGSDAAVFDAYGL